MEKKKDDLELFKPEGNIDKATYPGIELERVPLDEMKVIMCNCGKSTDNYW